VGDAVALQAAVSSANSSAGPDTITLAAGCTYTPGSTLEVNANGSLTIIGNGATLNGRLEIIPNAVVVINTLWIKGPNAGGDFGGAIWNRGSLTLSNSVVTGGGANIGAGIFNDEGTLVLNNSTISGNIANRSGGGVTNRYGVLTLKNSIIANNSGGNCTNFSGTVTATNSLVQDGECDVTNGTNGNLTGNPGLGTDLRPLAGSIVVNTGSNDLIPIGVTTDLAGNPRIVNIIVDMGAYENQDSVHCHAHWPPRQREHRTPTASATATATPVPPSATATATATPTLTASATATATTTPSCHRDRDGDGCPTIRHAHRDGHTDGNGHWRRIRQRRPRRRRRRQRPVRRRRPLPPQRRRRRPSRHPQRRQRQRRPRSRPAQRPRHR
jgi:hypothetical protein